MGFKLPDLILETVLRAGLKNARLNPAVIDDVFSDLTATYAEKKYGESEINKIKKMVQNKEVSIVHSFNLTQSTLPCISIQLTDDREDPARSHMGDFTSYQSQLFTDPVQIAATVYVSNIQPTAFNPLTGVVSIPDSVDLSSIYPNLVYIDSAGNEHVITGGINNAIGHKQFAVDNEGVVALGSGGQILTTINYEVFQTHGNIETSQLILGIHTKDSLLTKYLYILVKYIILSRKISLTRRGFQLTSYSGSDFHRNAEYGGDVVYTRFFNVSGLLQHSWKSFQEKLVDNVQVQVQVAQDRLTNEQLNLENQTVQVKDK